MFVFIASSANKEIDQKYLDLASDVSEIFASRNYDLLFGAANYSMMGECYRTFRKYKRKVYAYTVPKYERDFKKLPYAKCVKVKDTLVRFQKMYYRSNYVIILPGGIGSLAEFACSLEEYRASLGNKKIILYNYDGYYDDIIKWMKKDNGFFKETLFKQFNIIKNTEELISIIEGEK